MANVVDFSQLRQKVTPWGEVLDPITEELQLLAKQKHAREMLDASMAPGIAAQKRLESVDAERERHNKAVEDRQTQRDRAEQTVKNSKERAAAEKSAREAAARGETDVAEQIGRSYQEIDPMLGGVSQGLPGFKVDRGLAPSVNDLGDNAESLDDVLAANSDFDKQRADYERKQSNPDITIAGVTTNQDALRHNATRAAAADMQKTEDALMGQYQEALTSGDAMLADAARRRLDDFKVRRTQVEGGTVKPGDAAKGMDTVAADERRRATALATGKLRNEGTKDVAETNAAGRADAGRRWEVTNQRNDDKEERQKRGQLRMESKQLAEEYGIKDAGKTIRGLEDLNSAVSRGATNSADAARAIGRWVQLAQRDSRISNADIGVFFGRIGGIEKYGGDPFKMLDAAAGGKLQPEVIPQILEAAQAMLEKERGNIDQFIAAGDRQFPGFYGKHWDDFKAGLSGMGTQKPKRDLSNPDDPNGPDADRPLDGDAPAVSPPAAPGRVTREQLLEEARRRGLHK